MQPLDIGVCLKKSIVALESIGHLCPANMLTNPALDPFGKIPEFKFCAVKLEA